MRHQFLIGFFAGICAAFIPRFGPILTNDTSRLTIFPGEYIAAGIVFGVLIGGVMMILEYRVPRPPKETFITALGVPALIAGALNTASNTSELKDVASQQSTLAQSVARQLDIPVLPAETAPLQELPAARNNMGLLEWLPGVSSAHAADGMGRRSTAFNTSIQVREQQYVVVLEEARDREQAIDRAQALRAKVPQAQAVQIEQRYLVIQGGAPKPESAAVADAVRLKKETDVQPKLLPVK